MRLFSPLSGLIWILFRGVVMEGNIGARPRHRRVQNPQNQPAHGGQGPRNEGQQQNQPIGGEFGDDSVILSDWRTIPGVIGAVLKQKAAICWAIVIARLVEGAYRLSNIQDPTSFLEISYQHLVKRVKKKTKEMEILSFKKCFKLIRKEGIAKQSPTAVQNDDLALKICWEFDSEENADFNFIENKLNTTPVGIVIDIDEEFNALHQGIYTVQMPSQLNSSVKHALLIVGRGHTTSGQQFLIVQNSWDNIWGVNGYGRIALGEHTRCLVFYPLLD